MLRRIGQLRHGLMASTVVGLSALAGFGVIGAADGGVFRLEHFDAKQVTVTPAGAAHPEGVRIREVVDIDVGLTERRGYQRLIPVDFGEPVDIEASSPDADATVNVARVGAETRIRLGNPNRTFTGQRRYVLEYTLPDARLDSGFLALDVIGTEETLRTDAFTVVVDGFEFDGVPNCSVGRRGAFGGCEFEGSSDGSWTTVIEPLRPGQGITIDGEFTSTDPSVDPPLIPSLPDRVDTGFSFLALPMAALAGGAAVAVFMAIRRRGSNSVFGSGAATDAAFGAADPTGPEATGDDAREAIGALPLPDPGRPVRDVVTHRVPDDRLADLATIEFVPPRGLDPWQGTVLLSERVGDDSIRAWFSEMIAQGNITTSGEGSDMQLHAGPTDATLHARDRALLAELFRSGPTVSLGTYDEDFSDLWKRIGEEQEELVNGAGWWERPIGAATGANWGWLIGIPIVMFIAFHQALAPLAALFGAIVRDWYAALAFGVLVSAAVAAILYWPMLASRTATGSALTLRTESFRRFLVASEGRHVDWAWEHGLIREYSAWAVALDAATAWSAAIRASSVPDRNLSLAGPLVMYTNLGAFRSTTTAPSSSSGGGGGFSGGVGGGGGGGSSGSW